MVGVSWKEDREGSKDCDDPCQEEETCEKMRPPPPDSLENERSGEGNEEEGRDGPETKGEHGEDSVKGRGWPCCSLDGYSHHQWAGKEARSHSKEERGQRRLASQEGRHDRDDEKIRRGGNDAEPPEGAGRLGCSQDHQDPCCSPQGSLHGDEGDPGRQRGSQESRKSAYKGIAGHLPPVIEDLGERE